MKITKKQLRQIIKEEKSKLLNENRYMAEAESLQDQLLGMLETMDPMDRNPLIYSLIDELETMAQS